MVNLALGNYKLVFLNSSLVGVSIGLLYLIFKDED